MLADWLVASEAASNHPDQANAFVICRVCEKLRHPLTSLIGIAGHNSLLARSLTLAKREAPALSGVQVREDGSLHGFEGEAVEVSPILIAHFLNLLTIFVGETLTVRLLQDVWPDLSSAALGSTGRN